MRSIAIAVLLYCFVTSCKPTTTPTPPEAGPAQPVATVAGPPAPAAKLALPAEQRAILDTINDSYEEETDVETWRTRFEKVGREVHDRRGEIIAELRIEPGSVIADVGAGTGLYTLPFAEAVGAEGRVYAVDIQPYFLDHIQRGATEAGYRHVETVQATVESAELPAAAIDLVFMCDAYHHIEDPQAYLRTLKAALKPDGRLVIIDYQRGEAGTWRHDHIRAAPAVFRAEIEAAGFQLEREVSLLKENFFFVFRPA